MFFLTSATWAFNQRKYYTSHSEYENDQKGGSRGTRTCKEQRLKN